MTETPLARQQQVLSWLRRHAIPLAGVEAGLGFADLQSLKTVIGSARIVALGEATHGTREFFQLKHRLLEFLVIEMGFTTFAIEANWPESLAVNDYVLHGRGDPAKVLAGLHFWTWNTEEVLDLIHWMRQYNAHRIHEDKVRFVGFDAQFTALAATTIRGYLTRVDPAFATEIAPRIALFEKECRDYSALSEADIAEFHSTAQHLAERLRAEERSYVARSTLQDWRLSCQYACILRQVDEQRRAGDDKARYMSRDSAMAENVGWILENEGPRCKIVIWAHNGHVARDPRGIFGGKVVSMGMHLARRFDRELLVVGFAFGEGAFQALVKEEANRRPLREVAIGPAPDETLDAALARTGIPVFMLDLRHEDVAPCLQKPQVTREIGAFFDDPEGMCHTIVPTARYDVLAFIAKTTRARPNPHPR
jgi:erythromycin esterase